MTVNDPPGVGILIPISLLLFALPALAAFTDHSIPRRPRAVDGPPAIPAGAALAAFDGFRSGDRELGLAYATVAIADNNRVWGMRAFELLRKANAETPDDEKVASKPAELYDRMGKEDLACALYARVVAADAAQSAAAVNLGACLAKQGRMDESILLWKSALERSPVLEPARLNLAVALYRSGDVAGAQAALREGLKFNPAFRKAAELLREMAGR